jgi:hypothetical protein
MLVLHFSRLRLKDTFMLLGFSSNGPLRGNFCGALCFNSLVAKPLSDLYDNSSSNFQKSID